MTPHQQAVIVETCQTHGITYSDMAGTSRQQPIALARQHCYWKMWKAGMNFTDIGKALNRDRTTVRHGVAMIARAMHNQKWLGA